MTIHPVIPRHLYRSPRPGYPSHDVPPAIVNEWLTAARHHGIKTIICLLADKLAYYPQLGPAGLLGHYREAGFTVLHYPVIDHTPVPDAVLAQIADDYRNTEHPILVHCSAGLGRTGTVINFLRRQINPEHHDDPFKY